MNYKNKGSWDARTYDQVSYLVRIDGVDRFLNGENGLEMKLLWMQGVDQAC